MSAARPLLVLVHGFLGTPEDWAPMRRALAAQGIDDAVTVDLVGCARGPGCTAALERAARLDPAALADSAGALSAHVGGREHAETRRPQPPGDGAGGSTIGDGLDALATALAVQIDASAVGALEGRPIVLCGYSLGGRVCLALAGRGHAVCACILIGADPGIEDPRERSLRAGRDHAHATHLLKDPEGFLAAWYAQPLFASLRTCAERDEMIARRRSSLADGKAREHWARILDACSPGRCAPRWDAAAGLGRRLAFLHGALDDKFSAIARRIHVLSPRVPTISIPGAGHAAHVEQPKACADAVASIIAASDPSRP